MISITHLDPNLPTLLCYGAGGYGSVHALLVTFDQSGLNQTCPYSGILEQGSRNIFGDTACTHEELVGQLTIGARFRRVTCYTTNDSKQVLTNQGWITFSTIVSNESSGVIHGIQPANYLGPAPAISYKTTANGFCAQTIIATKNSNGDGYHSVISSVTLIERTGQRTFRMKYRNTNVHLSRLEYPAPYIHLVSDLQWTVASPLYFSRISASPLSEQAYLYGLHHRASEGLYIPSSVVDEKQIFGNLCQDIAQDARVIDTNLYTLIPELINIKTGIKDMIEAYLDALKKHTLPSVASAYLGSIYGPTLTAKDLCNQAEQAQKAYRRLRRNGYAVGRARHTMTYALTKQPYCGKIATITHCAKAYYNPYPFSGGGNIFDSLSRLSIMPTTLDVWDMVPFSFVIDWFFNMSRIFDCIDARVYVASLPIRGALYSRKITAPLDICDEHENISFQGEFHHYIRQHGYELYLPYPTFSELIPDDFHNIVEATSIGVVIAPKTK